MNEKKFIVNVVCDFFLCRVSGEYQLYKRGSIIQMFLIMEKLIKVKGLVFNVYQMGLQDEHINFKGINVNIVESKSWSEYRDKLNQIIFKGDIIHYNNIDLYDECEREILITSTIHTNVFLEKPEAMKWLKKVNKNISSLIVVNSSYYNEMYLTFDNVNLVKNGLCLNKFKFKENKKIEIKRDIIILFPNFDLPKKNRSFALTLINKLNEEQQYNYKLQLMGPASSSLNTNNNVEYIDEVEPGEEMNNVYKDADITIIPSLSESCSLCAMESMASGTVVIANDIEGIRDYVVNNKTGYLINVNNIDEWVKKIKVLISDNNTYNKIRKNARKQIEQNYNIDRVALNYYDIWVNVIEGRK